MIEARNIWKVYNEGQQNQVNAVRNINLKIKDGDFVTIVGPSGSGKSTLLHLIGCLDTPTRGEVLIDKRQVSHLSEKGLSKIRREKIGFIFQEFNLIPSLTALENVMLPLMPTKMPNNEMKQRAMEMLEAVGLEKRAHHLPSQLSGGEKQRAAIARAFINNPEIILADEPTGELDTRSGEEVMKLMKELNEKEKATVIVITHNLALERFSDRVIVLKDGAISIDKRR
jgi:putative ABC transport system ATP-binding protein